MKDCGVIRLKKPDEIKILAEGGKILAAILDELEASVKVGGTSQELEDLARKLIAQHGVKSSFLGYAAKNHAPFPAVTCVSVNEGVVHGVPNERVFEEGDLVGIDCGIVYKGMYLDSARTVGVGNISVESQKLMDVTRRAMFAGIEQAKSGNRIGDISAAIEGVIRPHGYGIVTQLVGHGVGYDVHEDPRVPNFGEAGKGEKIKEGLVIAIEPMVTLGGGDVATAKDGWTIETQDKSPAAHFEQTVAVTSAGPRILTSR